MSNKAQCVYQCVDQDREGMRKRPRVWTVTRDVLDALLTVCCIAPLVVSYWRGTFQLLDLYILPQDPPSVISSVPSIALSAVIALVGGLFFIYVQDVAKAWVHSVRSPISELMLKRIYCYVFGLVIVNHWRAVWALWDRYTGFDLYSGIQCSSTGMVVLLFTRSFRNSISPPVIAASDLCEEFFGIQTRFRVPRSRHVLFFLDCLFSLIIPGSSIVCVVRGFWYIFDHVFFFSVHAESYLLSLGLGIVLSFVALLLQHSAAAGSRKLEDGRHWFLKICFEDLFLFLACIAGINLWRGVWGLCNVYVFPSDPVLSSWTCHTVGMGGLMLLFHGSSALVKGYQIDGEFTGGKGCYLPSSSFTMFKHHMGQTHRLPGCPIKRLEHPVPAEAADCPAENAITIKMAPLCVAEELSPGDTQREHNGGGT
ncbi:hypothetical protein BV898_01075 [Hypsibius exemplaris]|uniref:Fuseless n=1 Tax=Hypsibius exemplaris TaxID=2072580 RepID=A0A1W0XD35_HYPEX|nr:hypothetical protein BV898_01075 [Hypsibius exemplaris]